MTARGREGLFQHDRMTTKIHAPPKKMTWAQEALELLNQVQAYYVAESAPRVEEEQPDPFQFANAA